MLHKDSFHVKNLLRHFIGKCCIVNIELSLCFIIYLDSHKLLLTAAWCTWLHPGFCFFSYSSYACTICCTRGAALSVFAVSWQKPISSIFFRTFMATSSPETASLGRSFWDASPVMITLVQSRYGSGTFSSVQVWYLGSIESDSCVVEGTSSHIGKRCNLGRPRSMFFAKLSAPIIWYSTHHKEGGDRVYFALKISRKKSKFLSCFYGRRETWISSGRSSDKVDPYLRLFMMRYTRSWEQTLCEKDIKKWTDRGCTSCLYERTYPQQHIYHSG